MKKALFMMLAIVATITTSCSKDAKINRRIDGEWKVKSIGSYTMELNESYVFKFNKDKKLTGDGSLLYTSDFGSDNVPFTYSVADQKITIVADGDAEVFSVSKYEKDKVELIDSNSEVWVLDPK